LSLSPATLKKYRVAGGGPPFLKLGRAVRYDVADLRVWVNARQRLRIPMIATGYSDRSRPPIPIDRDHLTGRSEGAA